MGSAVDREFQPDARRLMPQKAWVRVLLLLLPPIALASVLLLRDFIYMIATTLLPECTTYSLTGIYCPGCGLTRCGISLMYGDILCAVQSNAVVVLLLLAVVLLYAELVFLSFGYDVHFLPRKVWFYVLFGILAAAYFILRNFVPALMPPTLW